MATVAYTFTYTVDGVKLVDVSKSRTSTGNQSICRPKMVVGTSEVEETLPTDIGDAREVVITNHDTTAYVQVGIATGVYSLRIRPGDTDKLSLEPGTGSLFFLSDEADTECTYYVHEE